MKQFLLLLCWTLLRANEENFIPVHLFSTIEGPLCMTIRFDEDGSDCFFISLLLNHLMVRNVKKNFDSATQKIIEIDNKKIKSSLLTSKILLNTNNEDCLIENLPYYHRHHDQDFVYNYFPLTYYMEDEKFSIIHYLYNHNKIKNLGFGVFYNDYVLYLGEISKPRVIDYYSFIYNYTIPINETQKTWGCTLNQIRIGNYSQIINDYVRFETSLNYLYVPEKFWHSLKKNVLEPIFGNEAQINDNEFRISKQSTKEFPVVNITLGGIDFKFEPDDIFECVFGKCIFIMKLDKSFGNQWIFGDKFLKKYFTFFSYSKKSITFYSKEMLTYNKKFLLSNNYSIYLIIVTSIICFSQIGILAFQVIFGRKSIIE